MSLMEGHLRTFLLADGTISSTVGTRVYPNGLPQDPLYPSISYAQVSGVRVRYLRGPSGRSQPRIEVNSWAETYMAARALASAVRRRLDGYSGLMGTTEVGNVILDNEIDFFEQEVGVHRVMQDYIISHKEV